MGIGACVTLVAVGAVLAFATDWYVAGIDLNAVGYILMVAGALGLVVTLQVFRPRSRPTPPRQPYEQNPGGYYPPQQPPPHPAGQYGQHPPPPPYAQHPHQPPYGDGYR